MRRIVVASISLWLLVSVQAFAQSSKLLVAFGSYRQRPKYPTIYFYEHDGSASGKIIGSIEVSGKRSDSRPSLSRDGRFCAFASEMENKTSGIFLWDRTTKKLVEMPTINDSPNAQLHPTIAGDGKTIVFSAWNRPGSSQRWDLFTHDVPGKVTSPLVGINTNPFDERMPALNRGGNLLAFISNAKNGVGLTDIRLCRWQTGEPIDVPGLNSRYSETEPTQSSDGRLIAFISDRPGGRGGRDVYLYDRQKESLLPLPGLNSAAQEQSPSLSPDGRYIAFVSERIRGEGERDVFIYDRQAGKLLETPGLNAKQEDIDPCIIVLSD